MRCAARRYERSGDWSTAGGGAGDPHRLPAVDGFLPYPARSRQVSGRGPRRPDTPAARRAGRRRGRPLRQCPPGIARRATPASCRGIGAGFPRRRTGATVRVPGVGHVGASAGVRAAVDRPGPARSLSATTRASTAPSSCRPPARDTARRAGRLCAGRPPLTMGAVETRPGVPDDTAASVEAGSRRAPASSGSGRTAQQRQIHRVRAVEVGPELDVGAVAEVGDVGQEGAGVDQFGVRELLEQVRHHRPGLREVR